MQLQGRQWPLGRGRAWHRPCLRAPGGTASLANPGGETTPRDGAKGSSRTLSYCTNPRAPFPPAAPATPQWPPGAALVKEAGTPGALWVAVPAAWGGQRSWGSHRARGAPPPSHCLHSSCSLRVSVWAKHVSSGSILSIQKNIYIIKSPKATAIHLQLISEFNYLNYCFAPAQKKKALFLKSRGAECWVASGVNNARSFGSGALHT